MVSQLNKHYDAGPQPVGDPQINARTGATTQQTTTGTVHKAGPTNPNMQPTTAAQTATPTDQANLDQRAQQIQKRLGKTVKTESRVDFGAMLFDRMKKQS